MPRIGSFCFLLFFFLAAFLSADDQEDSSPMTVYKIHEAFVTDLSEIAVEPVDISPPAALKEKIPPQPNPEVIWIPGYWSWEDSHNDFVWVSGVWRRPPPKMVWVGGEWRQFDESWAWVKGFWSQVPFSETKFLADEPPEPLPDSPEDEGSEEEFWVSGCSVYDWTKEKYIWEPGYWEARDPDRILVPCHYKWRPEGFVYVPSYWDWPFDSRGSVYAPVYVPESDRQGYVYEPQQPYTPIQIIQNLFPDYPNYVTVYDYYSHYHPEYWDGFAEMPPWWGWRSWWSMDSEDQWALWWWYGNPGYPQPSWLTDDAAALFPEAPWRYHRFFSWGRRPFFVTPYGVYSARALFRARNEAFALTGRRALRPFLFRNHKFWDRLENRLDRKEARQRTRPAANWKQWKTIRPQRVPEALRRKKETAPLEKEPRQVLPESKGGRESPVINPRQAWERVRQWRGGILNQDRDRDGDGIPNRRDPDFNRRGAAGGERPHQQVQPQSPAVQQPLQQELMRRLQIRREQRERSQNQNQQLQNQPHQMGQSQNQQPRETEQLEQQWQRTRQFRREQQIQNNANLERIRQRQAQDETRPWRGGGGQQRQEMRQQRQEARQDRQEARQNRQERRQQRQGK